MTDLSTYLQMTTVIDADHPAVTALAARLAEGLKSPAETAAACFAWVRDEISHTGDVGQGPVPCRASDVLAARTGFCYAKSHLLAALLRANGIPAGLCYQRLSIDGVGAPFCLHGMVAVHLPDIGWYRCDPRGDKPGIATRFTPPTESLAYAPALPGECDIPGIHPAPLPQVAEALTRHATCAALADDLPDAAP
ncbi:MAG: transglutaminase family protein [Rhodospirillaceae bacterium]